MKTLDSPQIYVNITDGKFGICFDCPKDRLCKFALCEVMPPVEGGHCSYNGGYEGCLSPSAKIAALNAIAKKVKEEIKALESDLD